MMETHTIKQQHPGRKREEGREGRREREIKNEESERLFGTMFNPGLPVKSKL